VPEIAVSTDVIVGFPGETEAQFESTVELLRRIRYDQVFAAAYSARPGTPASRLADDVPPQVKRRRLNDLLGVQEGIGLARNEAWLGRDVAVLVDSLAPAGSHDHDAPTAALEPGVQVRLSGRTRGNKLVHLVGEPRMLGTELTVRVSHAGPYALRGSVVDHEPDPAR
jgi:tRNA-2-methylthio-N6-dimethylallyladenosine synthase